ncbi:AMP-binding protein [Lacisediminimonas profundi]|uniref:AMP-binding protein n=1 Tax=Lacisediminimonas profundi TaxID=2603856 RepID=UPI00138666FC|nr:AMP-binding protein [Lacisediminimonas profundi]
MLSTNTPMSVNPSPASWLERRAHLQPGLECIVYWHEAERAERWTYGQLQQSAIRLAAELERRGIKAGDRVAFLDYNDARFAVVMFAAARIGAIFVPVNFRLSAPEVVAIINDCDASMLIYGDRFDAIRHAVQQGCPCPQFVRSGREQDDELLAMMEAGPVAAAPPLRMAGWDETAWLLYTSGSTGHPKGVMLSHGNLFWNTLNIILLQGGFASDKVLISAPLFHAAPVATFMDCFLRGACIHLERAFDENQVLRRIADEKITLIAGVPAMYKTMAAHPAFESTDLSSLRAVIVGGAPVPEALIAEYRRREVAVIHRYGLTEATVLVAALSPTAPPSKQMSTGLSPLFSEFRIRAGEAESGAEASAAAVASAGEIGEIEVRGPNVMQGYWKREADTQGVMHDGWLRTGDLGQVDEDGYLRVAGRLKDMIITGGENVYATEVESRLVEYPPILEAAVIGLPDARWGETVCAVLSIKPGFSVSEQDVLANLDGRLARYKQPRRMIFRESLPKNGAGKVDKLRLRREYLAAPPDAAS